VNVVRYLLAVLLLLGFPTFAAAASAETQLREFLSTTMTLRAEFTQQRVVGAGGRPASGRLLLSRPGRFRWDYREPYSQLILADGERLWIYDPDLEQVIVKAQDDALGSSPARLLSGEIELDRHFTTVDLGLRDGLSWVELRPSGADDGEFNTVRLGFASGTLKAMQMLDNLGTATDIYFSEIEINIDLDSSLFSFTPPPGVDVLGE